MDARVILAELSACPAPAIDRTVLSGERAVGRLGRRKNLLVAEEGSTRLGASAVAQRGGAEERLGNEAGQLLREEISSGRLWIGMLLIRYLSIWAWLPAPPSFLPRAL